MLIRIEKESRQSLAQQAGDVMSQLSGPQMRVLYNCLLDVSESELLRATTFADFDIPRYADTAGNDRRSKLLDLIDRCSRTSRVLGFTVAVLAELDSPRLRKWINDNWTTLIDSEQEPKPIRPGKVVGSRIVNLELVLNQRLESFDEAEFLAAFASLGLDVKKVRIASIRRASVVVVINGDPTEIERAVKLLEVGGVKFAIFARTTRLVTARSVFEDGTKQEIHGRELVESAALIAAMPESPSNEKIRNPALRDAIIRFNVRFQDRKPLFRQLMACKDLHDILDDLQDVLILLQLEIGKAKQPGERRKNEQRKV